MSSTRANQSRAQRLLLPLTALGVVYGDIGTSPLYTVKQMFFGEYPIARTSENILGGLSLIFWTLTLIVGVKYIALILKADHAGEGGIFALLGLLHEQRRERGKNARALEGITALILFGAALLYGDGIITPAISVLSAYEGLGVATHALEPAIVPMTVLTLFLLFQFQRRGSTRVGRLFGPLMLIWFGTIGLLGLSWVVRYPLVLQAVNPVHGINLLWRQGFATAHLLGAVVLCVTGAEALYADLGHFGRRAIRLSWFSLVYPALLLSYFGQGARLLAPGEIPQGHLFYSLVPHHPLYLYPLVLLSALSTVVASQALITGAFSLTRQAIALGFFPRLRVVYTSAEVEGQVYLPTVNWLLLFGSTLLVVSFGTSDSMGAAYGIAVTATMAITTVGFTLVARGWGWSPPWLGLFCGVFLSIDLTYFGSNLLKFFHGGYVPLLVAVSLFGLMRVWRWGRSLLAAAYAQYGSPPLHKFVELKQRLLESQNLRIQYGRRTLAQLDRAIVFLSSVSVRSAEDPSPIGLQIYMRRNGALPKHVILLNISTATRPSVDVADHLAVVNLTANVIAVNARYGYMETPDIPSLLVTLKHRGLIRIHERRWTVQVGEEEIIPGPDLPPLPALGLKVFLLIQRFTSPADRYFGLRQYPGRAKTVIPIVIGARTSRIILYDDEFV